MLQANKPVLGSDTSRALLIKNENSYRPENYTGNDFDLYVFMTGEIGSANRVSSWLYSIDTPADNSDGGNSCELVRKGNNIYIKVLLDVDYREIEDTDICMSVSAARKLFVQIERLLVEMPDRAEIIWHEDGSGTIEWQPTSIRQISLCESLGRYCIVNKNDAQKGDYFFEKLLNAMLDFVRGKDEVVISWFYNEEPDVTHVGTFTFTNKRVSNIETIVIMHDSATGYTISLPLDLSGLLAEHAIRISNEKPSQIILKWYKHGAAFEWERDCDVASK